VRLFFLLLANKKGVSGTLVVASLPVAGLQGNMSSSSGDDSSSLDLNGNQAGTA
jgi:hypothetical protein